MKKAAPFLIILAGALWGSMGLFVRRLNAMGLDSMEISEVRGIMAVIILVIFLLIRDPGKLKLKPRNLPPLACSGIFSILFFNYCYFSAISVMDLSIAAVLLYTAPIFVMLLSLPLFREKLTWKKVLALILAFSGCCLVSGVTDSTAAISTKGLLLGLGAGLGYALYSIFSRFSLNQGLSSMSITVYTFVFMAIGGAFLTDFSAIGRVLSEYGVGFVAFAVLYSLITTVLPYLLYTTGLTYVENGAASVMASTEPVVATIMGFAVFSEVPTVSAGIGIVLVLTALVILNLSGRKKTA